MQLIFICIYTYKCGQNNQLLVIYLFFHNHALCILKTFHQSMCNCKEKTIGDIFCAQSAAHVFNVCLQLLKGSVLYGDSDGWALGSGFMKCLVYKDALCSCREVLKKRKSFCVSFWLL